jgi:hypothetical protein
MLIVMLTVVMLNVNMVGVIRWIVAILNVVAPMFDNFSVYLSTCSTELNE